MINRLEYPITYEEVIKFLREESARALKENQDEMSCGDPGPELLNWAADRLEALKEITRRMGEDVCKLEILDRHRYTDKEKFKRRTL